MLWMLFGLLICQSCLYAFVLCQKQDFFRYVGKTCWVIARNKGISQWGVVVRIPLPDSLVGSLWKICFHDL